MKKWLGLSVFLILVFFDQITKYFAYRCLRGKEPVVLLRGIFELQYLENRGAAFGILQNKGVLFIAVTLIFILFAAWFYWKIPEKKKFCCLRYVLLLLAAGAVGNMIDRMFRGYVVDFFYFSLIHFPIFNVADCYVTIAAAAFVILLFFYFSEDDLEELMLWKKQ